MITTNVLQRTFQMRYGDQFGTCFTIDVSERQYLVTARHVVEGIHPSDVVQIQHDQTWKDLNTTIAWISVTEADIAILSPEVQISPAHPLVATTASLALGQDVYFCGYPYGLKMEVEHSMNRGFPLPLVKKGVVSSLDFENRSLIIDGINNPGFSGGPVVFSVAGSNEFRVAGVISGYRINYDPVLLNGKDVGLRHGQNTGLIVAYDLKNGVEHISQNPTGVRVNAPP
jgi:S1-C subfamily serine protease